MAKQRTVIDTNVLISAALLADSIPARAVKNIVRHHVPLIAHETYAELETRLLLPKFDTYVPRAARLRFLQLFLFAAEWVAVNTTITVCRDPNDNKFLELAVAGSAGYLISGDRDLLTLNPFQEILIVAPRAYLELGKRGVFR